jgi:NAD(P)-dependent dehydrogenase (short-subunit alcohol dehydrogenase family)
VRELAARGWDVAILARGQAGLDAAAGEVQAAGRRALPLQADVADEGGVEAAADRVETDLGPIGLWVNVAFSGYLEFLWDTSIAEFRRVSEVTYYGQVHGTRAALRHMRPRNRGVIINVGSAMAYRGIPLQAAYCGAKHAVKGFTEAVITELAHEKSRIKVCMVQLPGLNTPQFQLEPQQDGASPDAGAPDLPA